MLPELVVFYILNYEGSPMVCYIDALAKNLYSILYYNNHIRFTSIFNKNWLGWNACREVIDEYGKELVKLCGRLMKILSVNLGLSEEVLQNAFGGEDIGACLRVNYYPKCPQPDLTLGLSSHSDPGGMTLLLPDNQVTGLQVRKDNKWITVKPARHAFIVNIGDQIQVTPLVSLFLFIYI